MSTHQHNTKHLAARRRGALAVLVMLFVAIGVVAGGLSLNWAYGVLVQRDMHHKTDALALAGARALLHPEMLTTSGAAAADIVLAVDNAVGDTLAASNAASPLRLQLAQNNVTVILGRVADVTQKVDESTFSQQTPYNTVRVIAERSQADGNPVAHLIGRFGRHSFKACEVGAQSYATLDNLVVGVRPTADAPAPVMPLAIEAGAWMNEQFIDDGIGAAGVEKFTIRLFCGGVSQPAPNAAVVGFNGNVLIGTNANAEGTAPYQVTRGLVPSDLAAPEHVLGPISSAAPALVLDGRQTLSAEECNTLAAELNAMIGGAETCRIFLLYEENGSDFRVTGLVGARVLATAIGDDHLEITIEKGFVVHPTVLTSSLADGPNALVHKLRISR
jgi:hypothetical protein